MGLVVVVGLTVTVGRVRGPQANQPTQQPQSGLVVKSPKTSVDFRGEPGLGTQVKDFVNPNSQLLGNPRRLQSQD